MLVVIALVSFAVAFVAVRVLVRRFAHVALDRPNLRSLHEQPVPRTGGIAVLLGSAVATPSAGGELWLAYGLGIALAAVSFADDLWHLPTSTRLLAHVAAAAVLVWYVLSPMHPLEIALLIVGVAWITNAYNFMDGSDGLAGGMAVFGFGAYAVAAWLGNEVALARMSIALCAGAAAFLVHNSHPARIFLGDVGSIPLGFLAGALGIIGWRNDLWPLWFPVLVFGPFIGDATITLVKRLARGHRVWRAHREHYYQRMVRMGFGHRRTALIGYALMALCGGAALAMRTAAPATQAAGFVATALFLALFALWVDVRWARFAGKEAQ